MKAKEINGEDLAKKLIGKRIIKVKEARCEDNIGHFVDGYKLYFDNGDIFEVAKNEGCGGCGNGWSEIELLSLNNNNNVITNAEYIKGKDNSNYKYDNDAFTIFVYYENGDINKVYGSEGWGNGYYGGGFYLNIKKEEKE